MTLQEERPILSSGRLRSDNDDDDEVLDWLSYINIC